MMFDAAYNKMRKFEGGYSNHPNDRGGATVFGISSKYWPQDFNTVKSLLDQGRTQEAEEYTKNFYKKNFWDASGAEKAPSEMQPILFDAAVNHGVGKAKKMLASSSTPNQFLDNRQQYMNKIVQNDPSQAVFQKGWNNRVEVQRTQSPDELTPEEQAELAQLEGEFGQANNQGSSDLTPAEQAELAQLEAEFSQPQKAPQTQEKSLLERGLNIGAAGADSYTWGMGPKIAAGMGTAISKPILEVGEKVNNLMGGSYQAPALKDLYLKGVDMYSRPGKEAWKDDPALAFGASLAGGLKSGTQLAKTKIGTTVGNSLRNSNLPARVVQSAALGAGSGAVYGAGQAEPGRELEGGAAGLRTGAALGGIAPVAGQALGGTLKTLGNAVAPFTQGGREKIVGKVIRNLASDPDKLNFDVPENIPGSKLSAGQRTGDLGLLSAERGLRSVDPEKFAQFESAQNLARNKILDQVAGFEGEIPKLKKARDRATGVLREFSFSNKKNVLPGEPLDKIDEILASPAAKRDAVKSALEWAREKIISVKDPEELYAVRQDINDAMQGKFDADKPALKLAKSQLKMVKEELDKSIERGAPGFKKYLEKYKTLSKPINQKEVLQEIRAKSGLSSPDPRTGYDLLSQPKFTKQVETQKEQLAKLLSPEQMNALTAISKDLDMASASNNPLIRAPGSDTFQNLAAKNMLGEIIGKNLASTPFASNVARPLSFVYKPAEKRIQEQLIDALLNPELAKKALNKVPKNNTAGNARLQAALIAGQLSNQ